MKIHSFDLIGKQAHFRKYYANNTAFSFSIPPPTTVSGIIGAILGRRRDSYYEELGSNNLKVGISLLSPIKKSFHRLNLLMIKSEGDFRGQKGRVQTPFEVVFPYDPRNGLLHYRIYLSSLNSSLMDELGDSLTERKSIYNLSLGVANFNAAVINPRLNLIVKERFEPDNFISIHSAVPSDFVDAIDPTKSHILLEEDQFPTTFKANYNRELAQMTRLLFSNDGQALSIRLNSKYWQIDGDEQFVLLP